MADRTVKTVLTAEVSGFVANYRTAQRAAVQFADKVGDGAIKNKQHLSTLSTSLGLVGAGAAGMAGLAIKSFADFDRSMSNVRAATHETAGNMDLLRKAALKAGADTAFSATEAADAEEQLAKAGVSTKDILSGGLTGALSLAAAGNVDVGDAAEYAATAITQFHLAGSQVPHVADLMAAAAGKAQGEVTDMAEALKYVGPIAGQMGVSIEQASGTIALLASNGIIGEQAGTSLRGMLSSLTSPSAKAADKMAELGINVYDAAGNFVGFDGVAGQLQDRMGGLDNATRDAALGIIFGNEQLTAARVLYAGGAKAVDDWTRKVNDGGYAVETAAIKMDNLYGDLERLKGSLSTVFIQGGGGSGGGLRILVQQAEDAVNAFGSLPGSVQSATVAIVGAGGLVLLGVAGMAKLVTAAAEVKAAYEGLALTGARAGVLLRMAGVAGAVLVVTGAADRLVDRIQGTTVEVDKLSASLLKWNSTGRTTGAAAKLLGDDMQWLDDAFARLASPNLAYQISNLGDKLYPLSGPLDDAKRRATELDQALAGLVQGGNGEQAAKVFAKISAEAKTQGVSVAELNRIFPQYTKANKDAKDAAEQTGTAIEGTVSPAANQEAAVSDAAAALKDMDERAQDLIDSLDLLNGTMGNVESASAYQGAIDDATARVKDYRKEVKKGDDATRGMKNALDITTKAGRDNVGALTDLWHKTTDYAEQVMKTTGDQSQANAVLSRGREQLVKVAAAFLGSKTKAEDYVTTVLGIPKKVSTNYSTPGLSEAERRARLLKETADYLNGKKVSTQFVAEHIDYRKTVYGESSPGHPNYHGPAAGGLVRNYQPVVPLQSGGLVVGPGGPRDDAAGLFALSNREFVNNAMSTRRNLPLLRALNAGVPADQAIGGQPPAVNVQVYVGDREITDIVDVRISQRDRSLRRRALAGTGAAR